MDCHSTQRLSRTRGTLRLTLRIGATLALAAMILGVAAFSLPADETNAPADVSLVQLARDLLGTLTESEECVVRGAATGEAIDVPHEPVRAAVVAWLCTDPAATSRLPRQGMTVQKARITGMLDLRFAKLGVPLTFHECEFDDVDVSHAELAAMTIDGGEAKSFLADQLRVSRDLCLTNGFTCRGEARLAFAWIEGHLDLSGACLGNSTGDALLADGCRIDGDLRLRSGFLSSQRVSLSGVRVAGNFDCDGARLQYPGNVVLSLPGARISGDWTLRGAAITGGVLCHGATVTGDLDADGSRISNPEGTAFRGYALEVGGDLRFVEAKLSGDILLEAAEVGRDLNFADARFESADPPVEVNLQGLTAVRRFRWTEVAFAADSPVQLDLRSATVGVLYDDRESWPPVGYLKLHGFEYGEIHDDAPFDPASRIEWLRRQHTQRFRTQPYEQLAETFRKGGLANAARDVLIAKESDRATRSEQVSLGGWFWYRVFGPTIGYGYAPGRAFVWMIGVVLMGATFFQVGYWFQWMTPTKVVEFVSSSEEARPHVSAEYPKFNAIVYSLDVFTPFTYLSQANYWVPNPNRGPSLPLLFWNPTVGSLLRTYLWLHVVAGWTLTSLLVAGLSGLVQQ